MGLSADIADSIVAVDQAIAVFESALPPALRESREWVNLKEQVEDLQWVSLGEGMHFDSLEEARNSGNSRS